MTHDAALAGDQRGAALSVAGVATLLTNALPIAAGTVLLHEGIPTGALGVLRVLAFAEYLETHARRAYSAGAQAETVAAKAPRAHPERRPFGRLHRARDWPE